MSIYSIIAIILIGLCVFVAGINAALGFSAKKYGKGLIWTAAALFWITTILWMFIL